MTQRILSILVTAVHFNVATVFNRQPQFSIKAEMNKAFDKSCNVGTFQVPKSTNGTGIADCLEHCLKSCICKSFQVCHNTQCELCSTDKNATASLLSYNNDCIYAMYEIKHLIWDNQCSGMNCPMKYNCCQQSGLCSQNKICRPVYNITQPWKRFTCDCPDGYYGDNCEQPITSCKGHYSKGSSKSGRYKVLDDNKSMYDVYCHFDAHGAWTLVQSYNLKNYTSETGMFAAELRKPMYENAPVSENKLTWSGYRLSKTRMQSIQKTSEFLRFTCNYKKNHEVEKADYLQMKIKYSNSLNHEIIIDVLKNELHSTSPSTRYSGKIGGKEVKDCSISLHQLNSFSLHVHVRGVGCSHAESHCYFGNYRNGYSKCPGHQCAQNDGSTTQLWFGHRLSST